MAENTPNPIAQVAVNDEEVAQKQDLTHYEPPLGVGCHRIKPAAEKIFDTAVYGGIGWVANAILSTSIAYFLKHGAGKQKFQSVAESLAKVFNKQSPNVSRAMNNLEFLSLVIGGTLLMWPVDKFEHNKPQSVRTIDKALVGAKSLVGIKETKEERIEKEAAFRLLEAEPKQSALTTIRARFVGLGTAILTLNAVDKFSPVKNNDIKDAVAKVTTKAFDKHLPGKFDSAVVGNVSKLATIDVIYSFVAAAGLYVDSHFINRAHKNHKMTGGFNPLNPANEQSTWVGRAKVKKSENFQEAVLASKAETAAGKAQ